MTTTTSSEVYRYHEYADAVLSGLVVACKWVRLAVQRHYRDLERATTDPAYPYYFDEAEAREAINFFPIFLRHYQGPLTGQPFHLEPWEQFLVAVIYGWKQRADGLRRFRKVYVSMARKNGKSILAVGIGVKGLVFDGEGGPRIVCAATKRAQARIVWDIASLTLKQNPELIERYRIKISDSLNATKISLAGTAADFIPLGQDSKTEDGHNIHVGIVDEFHEHPDDKMLGVIRTGMGARAQPLLFIITTAGFDISSPAYDEEEYLKHILSGDVKDDSYFGLIYTLDEGDDWRDPRVWPKSNPNLGVVGGKQVSQIADIAKEAERRPSVLLQLKVKELNMWEQSQTIWIPARDWKALHGSYEPEPKAPFYAGVDLSTTGDTTAYAKCFPMPDGKYYLRVMIHVPEYDIEEREKRERKPWRQWAEAGYVTITPGRKIDYDFVEAEILADAKRYELRELAYDPFNASQFTANLEKEGLGDRLVEFSQGWRLISPAAKDFYAKVIACELVVEPNPCLDWMVSVAEVKTDANENIRPVKPDSRKSAKHIDGVIASMMAVDRAVRNQKQASVYETRGVISV